jgi:RNA polymerase sigma factor (sigma-70 family)
MSKNTEKLIEDNYLLAYNIAYKFNAPLMGDDVKENLALAALRRAAEVYDPSRGLQFNTLLYRCITNALRSEINRLHKLPQHISQVVDTKTQELKDVLETLPATETVHIDNDAYNDMMSRLNKKLSARQQKMLHMFLTPEIFLEKYVDEFKPKKCPKRLTYVHMAKMLGISIAWVCRDFKRVQKIARSVLKNDI